MRKRRLYIFSLWIATLSILLSTVMTHHHHMGRICMIQEQCEQDGNINDEHTEHHVRIHTDDRLEILGCDVHVLRVARDDLTGIVIARLPREALQLFLAVAMVDIQDGLTIVREVRCERQKALAHGLEIAVRVQEVLHAQLKHILREHIHIREIIVERLAAAANGIRDHLDRDAVDRIVVEQTQIGVRERCARPILLHEVCLRFAAGRGRPVVLNVLIVTHLSP